MSVTCAVTPPRHSTATSRLVSSMRLALAAPFWRCGATRPAYSHSSMAMAVKPMDSTQNSEIEKV